MARYEASKSKPLDIHVPVDIPPSTKPPEHQTNDLSVEELWPDERGELCRQFLHIMMRVESPDSIDVPSGDGVQDGKKKAFILGGHVDPHVKSYEAHFADSKPNLTYVPLKLAAAYGPIILRADGIVCYPRGIPLRTKEFVVGRLHDGEAVGPIYKTEKYTAYTPSLTLQLDDYGGTSEVTYPGKPFAAERQVQVGYDHSMKLNSFKRIMPTPLDTLLFLYAQKAGL